MNKIELELKELENKINDSNLEELNGLEKDLIKKIKYLHGKKTYRRNMDKEYLIYIKNLEHKAKDLLYKIRKLKQKNILKVESVSIIPINDLDEIIKNEKSVVEKIKDIEVLIQNIYLKMEYLTVENKKIDKEKKFSLEMLKDYQVVHELEIQRRENLKELKDLKYTLTRAKSYLNSYKNPDIKPKKIERVGDTLTKEKKENKYYYLILKELINDDKNYFLLKELLENNPNFLNARFNNEHIIFVILYKYYVYITLENKGRENLLFLSSLLNIFLEKKLDLSYQERLNVLIVLNSLQIPVVTETLKEDNQQLEVLENRVQSLRKDILNIPSRVNLTKSYLNTVRDKVTEIDADYFSKNDKDIKNVIGYPLCDINNSYFIGNTFALDNSKYAISFTYDKNYNTYIRIHVLDTTFVPEYSDIYWQMKENNKKYKKGWSFKKLQNEKAIPSFTYQLKLEKNGSINSFKMFFSTIQIDEIITKEELLRYRENNEIKTIKGLMTIMASNYNLDIPYFNLATIESILDTALNIELKSFIAKNKIPAIYYVLEKYSEEEKDNMQNKICYYLSKISKKEADEFYKLMRNCPTNRYFTTSLSEVGKLELDPKNFIGYLQLQVFKCFLNSNWAKLNEYSKEFLTYVNELNEKDSFIDNQSQRKLEMKNHGNIN